MEQKKIYSAINEIMNEIDCIGKTKKNMQQGFMFRGIDEVMNTMKPLLAKHGVFVYPEVVSHTREERQTIKGGNIIYSVMTIKHHFVASDGSEIVTTTIGEGMDSGDKSSNKAMSIAYKYAMFQTFCIPTEEMSECDPDGVIPEPSTKSTLSLSEAYKRALGGTDSSKLAEFFNDNAQQALMFSNITRERVMSELKKINSLQELGEFYYRIGSISESTKDLFAQRKNEISGGLKPQPQTQPKSKPQPQPQQQPVLPNTGDEIPF